MIPRINDTIGEQEIICPYCKHEMKLEMGHLESQDTVVEQCANCEKQFYLDICVRVTTVATPNCQLNDEEHQWVPDNFQGANCKICGAHDIADPEDSVSE